MSDTPRTDAEMNRVQYTNESVEQVATFARTLERELTAAISAEEDWHRWAREVLIDWNVQFDDHKAGLRLAMVQLIKDRSAALTAAIKRAEKAEKEASDMRSAARDLDKAVDLVSQQRDQWRERAEKAEMELESLRKSFAVTEQCLGEDRDQWREVAGRLYELAYPKLIMPEATPVYRAYEEMVASENGGNNG